MEHAQEMNKTRNNDKKENTPSAKKLSVITITLLVGIGGILYGYDIGVISGALLFIHKSIPMTHLQTGFIVSGVLFGMLIGTLFAGPLADRWGRKSALSFASSVFILGIITILFSHSFAFLLISRLFIGIGVGLVSVTVPLYTTEIVPAEKRGAYVTFFQLFLTFGILLSYLIDLLFTPSGNWRAMFAVVLIPATILFFASFFLPETPRWLIAQNHLDKAHDILKRIYPTDSSNTILNMINTIQYHVQQSGDRWIDLINHQNIKAFTIAMSIAILNQWTGINTFLQYAPHILESAGMHSNMNAMLVSSGIGLLNLIFTVIALGIIDKVGRKPLLVYGIVGIIIAEIFLALVNTSIHNSQLAAILSAGGLFLFIISYAIGPGVVVWLAISELFPTKIRGKGIAACLFVNSLAGASLATIFLKLTDYFGLAGTYSLCAAFSIVYFIIAKYHLPETKELSLEEIQDHFNKQNLPQTEVAYKT